MDPVSPCHWVTSGPSVPRKTGSMTSPLGGRDLEAAGQVQGAGRSCESVPGPGAAATSGLASALGSEPRECPGLRNANQARLPQEKPEHVS